jgi:hypothetical protein
MFFLLYNIDNEGGGSSQVTLVNYVPDVPHINFLRLHNAPLCAPALMGFVC